MTAVRVHEFDIWRPTYAGATVLIIRAGTTQILDVFADEAMTQQFNNPQTLKSATINGVSCGKFEVPLYVDEAYQLQVNWADYTGIIRPGLQSLVAQDASEARATPAGGTEERDLEEFLGREIDAENFGAFGGSASANNAIITSAIAAAATTGGMVLLPPIPITFTSLSIPAGVVLRSRRMVDGATTLQSQNSGNVITLAGDKAGLMDLTLDGVSLVSASVGLFMSAKNETVLRNVTIKRFYLGLHAKGGRRNRWHDLDIDNCVNGARLAGDNNSGAGDEWRSNSWNGGIISTCTGIGLELLYVDKRAQKNGFRDIGFLNNTGTALEIEGGRSTRFVNTHFSGNTTNIFVKDSGDATGFLNIARDNITYDLTFEQGLIAGGNTVIDGWAEQVKFNGVEFSGTQTITVTSFRNIMVRNPVEAGTLTIAGVNAHRWLRCTENTYEAPAAFGVTTNATATKAWAFEVNPGQAASIEAVVTAVQRNGTDRAAYRIARHVYRPGATLAYDAQTANFTLGALLTGATSGATARIIADSDSGATGTLTLRAIRGVFLDDEIITDSSGGSAAANGTLSTPAVTLLGSTTAIQAAVETDAAWDADFAAFGTEVHINVTGAAAKTIDWAVSARVSGVNG